MELDRHNAAAHPGRVLIVDSDPDVLHETDRTLRSAGFAVAAARSVERALTLLEAQRFDLLVLDSVMLGTDGLASWLTARGRGRTPIIVSSVSASEADVVSALNFGADDYVTKPLQQRILLARINAILRRSVIDDTPILTVNSIVLDVTSQSLCGGAAAVPLTRLETGIVQALLSSAGRAVSAERLARDAWGKTGPEQRHALKQVIYRLRRKLERDPEFMGRVQTLRSAGYRWRRDGDSR